MIDDDDECGAVGGKRIGRGNRSTRTKPSPVPLCPPQIPYDLNPERRQLTVCAMARQIFKVTPYTASERGFPLQ
jgi:hypothetical protein